MNLSTGKLVTCAKITTCKMTELVIKAVEKFASDQGFKSLKFFNRKKEEILFKDSDLFTGVGKEEQHDSDSDSENSDDPDDSESPDDFDDSDESDDEGENESPEDNQSEEIDEEEIQEIISDLQENDEQALPTEVEEDEATDKTEISTSLPARIRSAPDRLEPVWGGKTYAQAVKQTVRFEDLENQKWKNHETCHNLVHQSIKIKDKIEYTKATGLFIARTLHEFRQEQTGREKSFGQQYNLKKGLKMFGEAGKIAATKEADQLYKRETFRPISVKDLSPSERRKAQESFMFLTQKRDNTVKGQLVFNGKPTRDYISREDAASPTAANESVAITCAIDAIEGRDVMTADIPNAFVQTKLPETKRNEDRVVMKITDQLVDMLVELDPELYGNYVVYEGGRKVIYVIILRALYGMLVASLLWYEKFRKDLESIGFEFNPYDPCIANRVKNGNQHTIRFHVDDIMSSHVNKRVNDKFLEWLNRNYGKLKTVTATRGKLHEYLGMTIDYSEKGKVKFRMDDYVEKMIEEFPVKLKSTDTAMSPASNSLFEIGNSKLLAKDRANIFHTFVAKALFLSKRARPDIQPTVAVLATRVANSNENDWQKLLRLMRYLNGTKKLCLTLKIDNMKIIKWLVDASFAVHPDFRSHTGGIMTMGTGAIQSTSMKQKLNTRSSTEAEIVGVDDVATKIFWTRLFIEAQGYEIDKNILFQDNKSSILLEENGRKSAGKRSRAMNIRYFFITDQVEKGNINIEYCPTDAMIGDFMTKPLQGTKFREFRKAILGM